jgi:phosphoglycolate phosphatase
MSLLVLFDVDGTLLLTPDDVYVEANRQALAEVYGSPVEAPDIPGATALFITRRALLEAGWTDDEVDDRLANWCDVFSRRYVELLRDANTSHWRIGRHAREVVSGIARRAVLTGNPEAVARARLARIGLADLFPAHTGAFGCEREHRVALLDLARSRAGDWPAERTVTVGDTPLDVSCAHTAGARCVAVATGRYTPAELAEADAVIENLSALPDALAALPRTG